MSKKRSFFVAAALCLAIPTTALADDKPKSADAKEPTSEELAAQAFEAYKKGDYPQALSLYQRAYQLAPTAAILYNMASIYDHKLNERDLAAEYYRRYLRSSDADPDLTRKATERLTELQHEAENAKPPPPAAKPVAASPPSPEPAPPRDDSSGSTTRTVGLVAGGLGIVSLGVGTVFGLVAKNKNDDAAKLCNGNACSDQRALTLTDDANRAATVSTITFIVGGALVAGGLTLYLVAPKANAHATTGVRIAPAVGPQVAGISVTGGWL